MPDVDPFISVSVQPSYGKKSCIINWVVRDDFKDSQFYVFKSNTNGAGKWKSLSTSPVSGESFLDEDFVVNNRLTKVFYRVVAIKDDAQYDSIIVSAFDKLSKSEYGAAHQIMNYEFINMSRGNGIQVFHYLPLVEGDPNPDFDADTGQKIVATCPNDGNYGMRFKGGYGPPIQTWIQLKDIGESITPAPGDQGFDDMVKARARMLAFPKPLRNHLIVHPPTDNRYLVGNVIKGFYFKGFVALAYEVELTLLNRQDPRYMLEVPSLNLHTVPWH